jgi:hypothetical protein
MVKKLKRNIFLLTMIPEMINAEIMTITTSKNTIL